LHSDDSRNHEKVPNNLPIRKYSSSYIFHCPTPYPPPLQATHCVTSSSPENDVILSSSNSVNELYNPDRVFTFDEDDVYSQSPLMVSTAVEESRPGYLQRDHSFVREVVGEIEAEKVEVIDRYTCMLLRRIKQEANLSEVEYGKLLMHIECGEVDDVCEVLEAALESQNYTPIYQIIYPLEDRLVEPGVVENEDDLLEPGSFHATAAPIRITDIGIQHLPPVFFYQEALCGEALVWESNQWIQTFVVIASDSVSVFMTIQQWRLREVPRRFVSFSPSMSVSEERMDHDVHYVCLEMSSEHRSGIFHLWKRHDSVLDIGSRNATVAKWFRDTIQRYLSVIGSR
ncbi:hypothetical protein WA588_001685, partial [Blastocystis sp. NMH]